VLLFFASGDGPNERSEQDKLRANFPTGLSEVGEARGPRISAEVAPFSVSLWHRTVFHAARVDLRERVSGPDTRIQVAGEGHVV
jgi:hypothetical protein